MYLVLSGYLMCGGLTSKLDVPIFNVQIFQTSFRSN